MAEVNWGSVADWVSGIGSFSAAVVALYVALLSQRVRLNGWCGLRIIVGGGQPQLDVFSVSVTNISQRSTVVTHIGFACRFFRWRRHGLINFMQDDISHGIPKAIADGETGNWNVRMGENNEWAKDLADKFIFSRFDVESMRFIIYTTNGGKTVFRPEKNIRDLLLAILKERQKRNLTRALDADRG